MNAGKRGGRGEPAAIPKAKTHSKKIPYSTVFLCIFKTKQRIMLKYDKTIQKKQRENSINVNKMSNRKSH